MVTRDAGGDAEVTRWSSPRVPGGEKTLRKLARELMATEKAMAERVRSQLRGSYSHHYRRMLSPLLAALPLRCNNTSYRPTMEAIELLGRSTEVDRKEKFYGAAEHVRDQRAATLRRAYEASPERFARPPRSPALPEVVWINDPAKRGDRKPQNS